MNSVEVEVKFAVADADVLAEQLRALGFREMTPSTFERNTLYDTPEHVLRSKRSVLRIRLYGQRWVLTHKCLPENYDPAERHKHRVEIETEIADGEALASILSSLGYREMFVYEKWRAEYSDGLGLCVVDRTPIGIYAELEGSEGWIDEAVAKLGLSPEALMTLSYGRLFERWKTATGSTAEHLTFAQCTPAED